MTEKQKALYWALLSRKEIRKVRVGLPPAYGDNGWSTDEIEFVLEKSLDGNDGVAYIPLRLKQADIENGKSTEELVTKLLLDAEKVLRGPDSKSVT